MNISDIISRAILEMLSENGTAEIKRNDFAGKIGCVPSQINYVLTSRFTPEQGFSIESRRGGGGYIRIKQLNSSEDNATQIMHIINSIGPFIDLATCNIILKNMTTRDIITHCQAQLISSAVSNNSLRLCDYKVTPYLRGDIFKNMLLAIANSN